MKPAAWGSWVDKHLGPHVPLFASFGNSRADKRLGPWLEKRAVASGAECYGAAGVAMICWFSGVVLVSSGGEWHRGAGADEHGNTIAVGDWIGQQLDCLHARRAAACTKALKADGVPHYDAMEYCDSAAQLPRPWTFCSFHTPVVGAKQAAGATHAVKYAFDACRRAGAVVLGGHWHGYRRDYWHEHKGKAHVPHPQSIVDGSPDLRLYTLGRGTSMSIVNGLGGHSVGSKHMYTDFRQHPRTNMKAGAVVCQFDVTRDGRPTWAGGVRAVPAQAKGSGASAESPATATGTVAGTASADTGAALTPTPAAASSPQQPPMSVAIADALGLAAGPAPSSPVLPEISPIGLLDCSFVTANGEEVDTFVMREPVPPSTRDYWDRAHVQQFAEALQESEASQPGHDAS